MPQRIQRKRTKGWRAPENAVYVGRPSKFGNPFKVGEPIPRDSDLWPFIAATVPGGVTGLSSVTPLLPQTVVDAFSIFIYDYPPLFLDAMAELPGRDLVCWCPIGAPCHGDWLLGMVNAELPHV